jgi:hypothetical protein
MRSIIPGSASGSSGKSAPTTDNRHQAEARDDARSTQSDRPKHDPAWATEEARLRALRQYGNFALAYSAAFQPDLDYFGNEEGFLAYKQVGSTAFVLSNPLAPIDCYEELIRTFLGDRGDVCFWQASRPVAKIL